MFEWLKTKNMSECKYNSVFKHTAQSMCQRVIWHDCHIPSEAEKEKEKIILKL